MTLPGPSWGTQDEQKWSWDYPNQARVVHRGDQNNMLITHDLTTLGGSHRPLPLRGDWQGPMTSLLDPGVPWSTLEGQGPERVPQGPE